MSTFDPLFDSTLPTPTVIETAMRLAPLGPYSLAETVHALMAAAGMIERAERAEAELADLHATDDYQRWALAVAERDAAREAVGRVRALCDMADRIKIEGELSTRKVRAALHGDQCSHHGRHVCNDDEVAT